MIHRQAMTGQVRTLIALRWRMVRSTRARQGVHRPCSADPRAVPGRRPRRRDGPAAGPRLRRTAARAQRLPRRWPCSTLLAPLIAGGGQELFPSEQLDAYPVTARTQFLASLVLTPLNIAWAAQLIALVGLTAFVSEPGPGLMLSVLTCLVFFAAISFAGHALAWFVMGLRQRAWGRRVSWAAGAVLALAAAAIALGGHLSAVLDAAPTTRVVGRRRRRSAQATIAVGRRSPGPCWRRHGSPTASACGRAPGASASPRAAGGRPRSGRYDDAGRRRRRCARTSPWTGPASGVRPRCAGGCWCWASCPGRSQRWPASTGRRS